MIGTTPQAMRPYWNDQHARLRGLLETDLAMAIEVFLPHHAMLHAAGLGAAAPFSFQDEALQALTPEQMRHLPAGFPNTVVWKLWHISRIEDATVNTLLLDGTQIFHSSDWPGRMNSPFTDVGNGMSPAQIQELSATLDLEALLAYRLAVGQRTRQVMLSLTKTDLAGKPLPTRVSRLVEDGTVRPQAKEVLEYWGGNPKTNLLLMPASRHAFIHFNEICRMLPRLRRA